MFFLRLLRNLKDLLRVGSLLLVCVCAALLPPLASAQTTITAPLTAAWQNTALTGSQVPIAQIKTGFFIDPSGELDIMNMLQRSDFAPLDPYHAFVLGSKGAAWLRLRVVVPLGNKQKTQGSDLTPWVLEIPSPLLDDVELYQVGPDQRLLPTQKAGDLTANAQWSYPSNTSAFKLNLYPGEPQDIWVRVKYPIATQLPIFLKTEQQYLHDSRTYFWLMGIVAGALFFLCLYIGVITLTFKDIPHLGFGAYLATSLATLFAYSGLNGYLGFTHSPRWVDASTGVWQLFSAAAALFFAGAVLQAPLRAPRLTLAMRMVAGLCVAAVPLYLLLDRATFGASAVFLGLITSYILAISMGVIAWRAGDKTGRIIAVFFSLLILNVIATLGGALGLVRFFWYQQLPVYVLIVTVMPLILASMNFQMRHQLAMQIRAQGLRSHDALTDTLNEPFFLSRLRTIMNTPRKRKGAALVLIDVSNLPYMRESFAAEVIEQTLLRAVIKIKRIFGEMDAIGRIGDHRLAVILDNADRERVGKLAVELIASGLMPAKNAKQDITIVFHFAVALLDEYAGSADTALPELQALCDKMSPRTQRPIRYLTGSAQANANSASAKDAASPNSTIFSPSEISAFAAEQQSPAARRPPLHKDTGHHAIHTSDTIQAAAPLQSAASTLPLGLHSSGQPSSGAAPSSSFHQ